MNECSAYGVWHMWVLNVYGVYKCLCGDVKMTSAESVES